MKVLIVGGVAGGASAAARLRRNDEHAQIVMFERGEYISFANCGLPYYIGDVIRDKSKLTVQTPESFNKRFNVDVRTGSEVISIDRQAKKVTVKRVNDGVTYEESYDKLILSPGAEPIRPDLPGFGSKKVFTLRNIPDTFAIKEYCETNSPKSAVIIGGGYIGIEMAENLYKLGIKITIVEMGDHVIPPIDYDAAAQAHNHLRSKGIDLRLNTSVNSIEERRDSLVFNLSEGSAISADFAVLTAGVAPETRLAANAGLDMGMRGTIIVDKTLKTSDENIYAVGDAIQVENLISGSPAFIPLASPANKQGRIAADNVCGKHDEYEGSLGTSILKVFDLVVASTGLSEAALKKAGISYRKSYTYSQSNASYYPGGLPMSIKLMFSPENGKILGAQVVGFTGVDKRIDVIAAVVRLGGTVSDLTRLELSYAPPFSSAKDPVNMAGYTAENILEGCFVPFYAEDISEIDEKKILLLDVRTEDEFANGTIPGAKNIPLDSLRENLAALPKDKEIYVFCQIGLRGYIASRILTQNGFKNKNLSGGYRLWKELQNDKSGSTSGLEGSSVETETQRSTEKNTRTISVDACGLSCPGPIMAVRKAMDGAEAGTVFSVNATDPAFADDIKAFCERTGNTILSSGFDGKIFNVVIKKGGNELKQSEPAGNDKSIVVFSGDLDKAIAAFIIANGAAAMGRKVHMFFTFWGLNILRKAQKASVKKDLISRMFAFMMPRGSAKLRLSKMNMGGIGSKMIRSVMRAKNISSLEDLMQEAMKNGVEITACSMSMDVIGLTREELVDGVKVGGVASFLGSAEKSDASLFI